MKAVILASGAGTRLRPLTDSLPKTLVRLDGDTILDHELKSLISAGIKEVLITTGHFEEKIRGHVSSCYPELKVEYVNNPMYATTNYIYSMWLAREKLKGDVIMLHGDLVFDRVLLERLLAKDGSHVLVNNVVEPPEKDFKGVVKDGIVRKIGVGFFGDGAFFLAPLYKLTKEDLSVWMRKIGEFVARGEVTCYAENAFNEVSGSMKVRPLYYGEEFCMEIDDKEDLKTAARMLGE